MYKPEPEIIDQNTVEANRAFLKEKCPVETPERCRGGFIKRKSGSVIAIVDEESYGFDSKNHMPLRSNGNVSTHQLPILLSEKSEVSDKFLNRFESLALEKENPREWRSMLFKYYNQNSCCSM